MSVARLDLRAMDWPRPLPFSLPRVVLVGCSQSCDLCAGLGEWVVQIPGAMLDVDLTVPIPRTADALRALLDSERGRRWRSLAPVWGAGVSRSGGVHLYLDAPATQCEAWAAIVDDECDVNQARYSSVRGWCGDRPCAPSLLVRCAPIGAQWCAPRIGDGWFLGLAAAHRRALLLTSGARSRR